MFGNIFYSDRPDGFVNATEICKMKNKKFAHWYALDSTNELITVLENKLKLENNSNTKIFVVDVKVGGNYKGSWIHPDLVIDLLQWIDKSFAIEVSRHIRELCIKQNENVIKTNNELIELQKKFKKLERKHNSLLSKRVYYKFKKGPCLYLISDMESNIKKYKIGIDNVDINVRLRQHRTTMPATKLEYLVYTEDCEIIEKMLLLRYRNNRKYKNHEWIYDIDVKELIFSIKTGLNMAYCIYDEENNIQEYNAQIDIDSIEDDDEDEEISGNSLNS